MRRRIARRAFLGSLLGATTQQSTHALAQHAGRTRYVGVLMGLAEDRESDLRVRAFEQGFEKEGWKLGDDLRFHYRYAAAYPERMRAFARELVGLRPDVIVGHSTPVVAELLRATRKIPIVFVVVADPIGSGFAASIPRPGGNATGFTSLSVSIPGKLLTILKQLTPNVARVGLMFNPESGGASYPLYISPFEAAAASFGLEAVGAPVRGPADIEIQMAGLARLGNAGLVVMPDNMLTVHREAIISLAAQLRLPAVYPYRYFAQAGGLMAYGVDVTDLFHRAPEYVSRILRGAKPGELPVQAPTKFELVINLSTAKALGLEVPKVLLAGADELLG
ncbi:MAG: ABC transporter substrate-binding protein [Xanthobacteraceae bacterium]